MQHRKLWYNKNAIFTNNANGGGQKYRVKDRKYKWKKQRLTEEKDMWRQYLEELTITGDRCKN